MGFAQCEDLKVKVIRCQEKIVKREHLKSEDCQQGAKISRFYLSSLVLPPFERVPHSGNQMLILSAILVSIHSFIIVIIIIFLIQSIYQSKLNSC
jgi:hypothetical protein